MFGTAPEATEVYNTDQCGRPGKSELYGDALFFHSETNLCDNHDGDVTPSYNHDCNTMKNSTLQFSVLKIVLTRMKITYTKLQYCFTKGIIICYCNRDSSHDYN